MKFDYGCFVQQALIVLPNYDQLIEQQTGLKSGLVVTGQIWELYNGVLYIRYQQFALPIDFIKTETIGKEIWYVKNDENGWLNLQALPYVITPDKPSNPYQVNRGQSQLSRKFSRSNYNPNRHNQKRHQKQSRRDQTGRY